jgi:hypothetical protein
VRVGRRDPGDLARQAGSKAGGAVGPTSFWHRRSAQAAAFVISSISRCSLSLSLSLGEAPCSQGIHGGF